MILDGWGIGKDPNDSAIELARTPNFDKLLKNYSYNTLRTDGEYVGLPKGQMGNSEVGHMNIGAGRIVHQDLAKINLSIKNNEFAKNKTLIESISFAKKNLLSKIWSRKFHQNQAGRAGNFQNSSFKFQSAKHPQKSTKIDKCQKPFNTNSNNKNTKNKNKSNNKPFFCPTRYY